MSPLSAAQLAALQAANNQLRTDAYEGKLSGSDRAVLSADLTELNNAVSPLVADPSTTPPPPPPPPPPSGQAGFGQAVMAAPAGYTKLIFGDKFSGPGLDKTLWTPRIGQLNVIWTNKGSLPVPYSGENSGDTGRALFHPSQIEVNDGLTITAIPNNSGVQESNYYVLSGAMVSTIVPGGPSPDAWGSTAKFTTPTSGKWYIPGKPIEHYPLAWGYVAGNQQIPDVGFDATAAFHRYGMEVDFDGGTVKVFVDGTQLGGSVRVGPKVPYEIILDVQAWQQGLSYAQGYVNGASGAFEVAEIQVWAA